MLFLWGPNQTFWIVGSLPISYVVLIHMTTTASQEEKIPSSVDIVIISQSEVYSQKLRKNSSKINIQLQLSFSAKESLHHTHPFQNFSTVKYFNFNLMLSASWIITSGEILTQPNIWRITGLSPKQAKHCCTKASGELSLWSDPQCYSHKKQATWP